MSGKLRISEDTWLSWFYSLSGLLCGCALRVEVRIQNLLFERGHSITFEMKRKRKVLRCWLTTSKAVFLCEYLVREIISAETADTVQSITVSAVVNCF